MNRLDVINRISAQIHAGTYLEIGVNSGMIINNVPVERKIGVDPMLNRTLRYKRAIGIRKFRYYKATSDDFFAYSAEKAFENSGVDIAFIDGLHEYEQVVRDIQGTLQYLRPGGVILVHDCNPTNYALAYPSKNSIHEIEELAAKGLLPGWNGFWNGDVWKAIVHMRIISDDLDIFTLDLDWGIGVICKRPTTRYTGLTVEELQLADYSLLETNRQALLNLQPPVYLDRFIETLKEV
ncbi:MAG: class I SAM-dependent methyltransferase [Chitinophagales bacterium]|nr:class I SAM-dependent methyltransferase [Chitinophagales bacterium]MCB9018950.1 class I SAM-dependent methyltransferase [Chitinophagales bacterium]